MIPSNSNYNCKSMLGIQIECIIVLFTDKCFGTSSITHQFNLIWFGHSKLGSWQLPKCNAYITQVIVGCYCFHNMHLLQSIITVWVWICITYNSGYTPSLSMLLQQHMSPHVSLTLFVFLEYSQNSLQKSLLSQFFEILFVMLQPPKSTV